MIRVISFRFRTLQFPAGIALVVALGFALSACDNKAKEANDHGSGRPVLVAKVHYALQSQAREFIATIKPRVETDQGFRVSGKVVRRVVEVGQRVKAGYVLATLDDNDLKLQKKQAEAEFSAARGALEQTQGDERRAVTLHQEGWVAQAALDRVRAAAQESRGRLERATNAVELAKNSLEYAMLRADADGVVTQTSVEAGQVVAAGQIAVRIARAGEMEASVALPEAYAAAAGSGEAHLFLWSNPEKTYRAKLRELSPSADPATRNFAARFSILDADDAMSLGMSATLTIASRDTAPLARVPLSALYNQGHGTSLWKVEDDGRLILTPVNVARFEANTALVTGGIAQGETIIVLGVQKLDAGQKVRAVTQDTN